MFTALVAGATVPRAGSLRVTIRVPACALRRSARRPISMQSSDDIPAELGREPGVGRIAEVERRMIASLGAMLWP